MSVFTDTMTLGAARAELRKLISDGHPCPCCTQNVKVYRRTIHATMARELIRIYKTAGLDWFHLPTVIGHNGGDVTKCRYWHLLEEDDRKREDGGRAGYWRLLPAGVVWVRGVTTVPKYAHVFDGRLMKLEGPPVSVKDCLGKKFDYAELMAAPGKFGGN